MAKKPARPTADTNPNTAQLLVRVVPQLLLDLDAYAEAESKRTGYPITRTDLVRRLLEDAVKGRK